jgi:hypothetical protein
MLEKYLVVRRSLCLDAQLGPHFDDDGWRCVGMVTHKHLSDDLFILLLLLRLISEISKIDG